MLERIITHRDYVWARIPFLAPMAHAVARRRVIAEDVARRITALRILVLDHLEKEEQLLAARDASSASVWVENGMLGDHLMIATSLDEILDVVARWRATEVERRLGCEIAALGEHVHAQIALEERLVAARLGAVRGPRSNR